MTVALCDTVAKEQPFHRLIRVQAVDKLLLGTGQFPVRVLLHGSLSLTDDSCHNRQADCAILTDHGKLKVCS